MNKYLLAYVPQSDAVFTRTVHKKISGNVEIDGPTMVDLDGDNHIVGMQILNFSRPKVDVTQLITKQLGNLANVTK
ncbi:MAG: DUF2283 domain-containing protein [Thermoplasmataceae archaeon]